MGRKRCENCGAQIDLSPDVTEASQRCGYCGALLSARATSAHGLQPREGSKRGWGIILGAVTGVMVIGIALLVLLPRGDDRGNRASSSPSVLPAVKPVVAPPVVQRAETPPPAPPAPPPREPTVHDQIREYFEKVDGRLCLAGNLSRFGPFAGTVHLTAHPEGRVSQLRVAMQPGAPKVIRCMQQAFSRGPVYRGRPVGVVVHFSGGRSADGLQYREGIELQGSAN
jgi:hypothetical protein